MSRVVAPSPEMRAAAPELIGALEPVYVAETGAEREAVFSFRYLVYGKARGRPGERLRARPADRRA